MKNYLLSVLLLLFATSASYGQFDDILKKAAEKVKITELPEEKNISTSLSDAQPEAYWLKTLESQRTVQQPSMITLLSICRDTTGLPLRLSA